MPSRPPQFLLDHLANQNPSRPRITLTWAQSLDSKIAGPGGCRVMISGPESMEMTHWLRTMHDAILLGINTIIMDDPRLKIQLVPQDNTTLLPPQPLILDPKLRFPLDSRLLKEWTTFISDKQAKGRAKGPEIVRQPWVICGNDVSKEKVEEVEKAGVRVIKVPLDLDGRISPIALPRILESLGLLSVMIEGGSRILSSFLHSPLRDDGSPLVDLVVITVAPMFIGEGVGVVPESEDDGLPRLKTLHTETMGKDSVMVCSVGAE